MTEHYDFIVVGSGSAGGAITGRLSENAKYKVLCLEAGEKGSGYIWSRPPAAVGRMYENPVVNWCYPSQTKASAIASFMFREAECWAEQAQSME